jgi:hypothetical protein
VLTALKDFAGKGRVLQTTLSSENEEKLRAFMEKPST